MYINSCPTIYATSFIYTFEKNVMKNLQIFQTDIYIYAFHLINDTQVFFLIFHFFKKEKVWIHFTLSHTDYIFKTITNLIRFP